MSGSNSNEREQRSAGRGDRGRDRGGGGGAPLDETLEAHTGSAASPGAACPPEPDLPPLDSEGRRRAIESPERDHAELVEVDPDHYVAGYEVARGGMGRIVAARDRRLGRVVAIKELIQNTAERAARLEREALITARLQHPAIVNLHEAGRWPSGQPFYAMKLVAGRSLAQVVSEPRPLVERLALLPNLIAMAEAVAYAHRHHIIHRDLKPSNVLIGELGETVVIDWGLAKDLAAEPGDRTHLPGAIDSTMDARAGAAAPPPARRDGSGVPRRRGSSSGGSTASLTIAGSIMGTPGYMPPEQAAGKDVDERADVFALGAILYHVLGGVEPYRGASSEAVLAAVLAGPPAPLERVEPGLAQDLVTIVEKAMAVSPDARYPTAFQLVEDLRRFQTGKLVGAHRYSRRELFWRFLVRQRAAVVAGLAALAAITVIALVSFQRVVAERDRAAEASVAAERRADELAVAQAGSLLDGDPRAALDLLARLSPGATSPIWRTARMVASDARLRGIPDVLRGHQSAIAAVDLSADGKLMVSADLHDIRVWDLSRGQSRLLGRQDSPVQGLVLAPDGRHAVSSGLDSRLRLWTLDGGAVTEIGGHDALVTRMRFLPDGQRLVSTGADGAVRLWRVGSRGGELVGSHQGPVFDLDVSKDGGTLASVGEDNVVRIWHPGQRGPVRELRTGGGSVDRVALSPDGTRVAAVGSPRDVWLWQVATGEGKQLAGHEKEVLAVAFSPDGARLATAGRDHTVRLWDVASGGSEVLRDHEDDVTLVQFAGADLLLSSALDGTVRVWMVDGTSASAVQVLGGHDRESVVNVSDDGSAVVTSTGTLLRRWQIGAQRRALRGHRGAAVQVEAASDGRIVSGSDDWTVRVWPARGGEPRVLRGHEASITGLAVSLDGRLAASIDAHRFAWLWDLARGTGRRLAGRAYGDPRFSPDGALVLAPSVDNTVRLWSTATGEARILRGHTSWVTEIALSPDGRRLASASADRTVRLWDFETGGSRVLEGHQDPVRHVEFAGAARLVSSDMGGSVREWEAASGAGRELGRAPTGVLALAASRGGELVAWAERGGDVQLWTRRAGTSRVLAHRETPVEQLGFSPDGRTLVGRDRGSHVLLWDTATDGVFALPSHGRGIADFAIAPSGLAIATADADHAVRVWPYDLPYDPGALRAWLASATGRAAPARR